MLHVNLAAPGLGGKERLLIDFFDVLNGREFDISICAFGKETAAARALRSRGCRVWALGLEAGVRSAPLRRAVSEVVTTVRPDILHVHGISAFLTATLTRSPAPTPGTVFTSHFSLPPQTGLRRLFTALLLRRLSRAVGVSRASVRVLADSYLLPRDRIELIHNGVDVEQFVPRDRPAGTPPTVGFCGVLRPEKQLPVLLQAVAKLRSAGTEVRLLVVGDGPSRGECEGKATEMGLNDSGVFVGAQSDVRPWLAQMDCFVLPSSQEAMPVALLEAMAMGRAVVASAVGGVPEVVEDGESGILVPPRDVDALAESLATVLKSANLRTRLGEAARRSVETRFSLARTMQAYADLYLRMAGPVETRAD